MMGDKVIDLFVKKTKKLNTIKSVILLCFTIVSLILLAACSDQVSTQAVKVKIIAFGDKDNIRICRIDHVKEGTKDGVFLTTEEQVLGSDTDPSDGWKVTEGAFAIAGVMKPYQLQDDEVVPDDDIYSYYRLLNGADSLVYKFTPADGSDPFSITKSVGVTRTDKPDGKSDPALYEFYNVFPENTLKRGNSYAVTIQAFDKNGAKIKGAFCKFKLAD